MQKKGVFLVLTLIIFSASLVSAGFWDDLLEAITGRVVGGSQDVQIKDMDAYIGEDINDPNWIWDSENLYDDRATNIDAGTGVLTTGPLFGISNDFVWNDPGDNPVKVGECIDLPNNYISICLDSLSSDRTKATVIIKGPESRDSATGVISRSGISKVVPIGGKLSDYFGKRVDIGDGVLILGRDGQEVSVENGSTSYELGYGEDVVLEAEGHAIRYYYKFGETTRKPISATFSNPVKIRFLNKDFEIKSVDSATKFTSKVSNDFYLYVGDVVNVAGKRVTLDNVGSTGAIVITVDGVTETIPSSTTETVNGIEITNYATFFDDIKRLRSAELHIKEAAAGGVCSDSDSGKDYYLKGTVTLPSGYNSTDYCIISRETGTETDTIREFSCYGETGGSEQTDYLCPNGCQNGACLPVPEKECGNGICESDECDACPQDCSSAECIAVQCIDSDGGKAYYVKGTVTLPSGYNSTDYCIISQETGTETDTIREFSCYGETGGSEQTDYLCPNGCKDGTCLPSTEEETAVCGNDICDLGECDTCPQDCSPPKCAALQCTDSDGGNNYYVKGTVSIYDKLTGEYKILSDSCVDSIELKEYICDGIYSAETEYLCPNGCKEGVCISTPPITPTEECNGCILDGSCVNFGLKISKDNVLSYCDIDGTFKPQKEENEQCINSYECLSDYCVNRVCVDIVKELKEGVSLLWRIWCKITNPFNKENYLECLSKHNEGEGTPAGPGGNRGGGSGVEGGGRGRTF